ncbi:MAG: hypothetical protein J6S17_00580 [Aeriscardovia sp.]|nr:hypothetical protein [Aeriscardovia sp.]
MSEEEGQEGASPSAKEPAEENLEGIKGKLEEIKDYLEKASKTEKDAAALEARLNLTAEERELTPQEKGYRANLKEDRRQALEGLKAIARELGEIEGALSSIPEEGEHESELKKCRKQEIKYRNEVEERIKAITNEEEDRPFEQW